MRTPVETQQINQFLGRAGLAQLDEPAQLVQQLATCIMDHDHFRRLLTKCDPEVRLMMYETLAPRLRFEAKTLGDYMIESALEAEKQQWPTVAADGTLLPFKTANIETDEYVAERAIKEAMAKERLWLICKKCLAEAVFVGERRIDCIKEARASGWTYSEINGTGREVCPKCP